MEDEIVLRFLRTQAKHAKYVTSVCTGALVLGAAGLLNGYRATTHWLSLPLLPLFGAVPVDERVVIDRNRMTGGGVTAGIDFGLQLAALLQGEIIAQQIQLAMEYNPDPPFRVARQQRPPKIGRYGSARCRAVPTRAIGSLQAGCGAPARRRLKGERDA